MGVLDGFAKRMVNPGPGVDAPPPKTGIKRLFFVLTTHFWKIVIINLEFLLFSIPLVTIPAAYCALYKTAYSLYKTGICDAWQDFVAEFKSVFRKSLVIGLIAILTLGLSSLAIYAYYRMDTTLATAGIIVTSVILLWSYCVLTYVFIQTAVIDLPVKTIIKNSLILSVGKFKYTLLFLITAALLKAVLLILFPFTLPIDVVIGKSLYAICAVTVFEKPVSLCIKSADDKNSID